MKTSPEGESDLECFGDILFWNSKQSKEKQLIF
jgi:hypothetical protein